MVVHEPEDRRVWILPPRQARDEILGFILCQLILVGCSNGYVRRAQEEYRSPFMNVALVGLSTHSCRVGLSGETLKQETIGSIEDIRKLVPRSPELVVDTKTYNNMAALALLGDRRSAIAESYLRRALDINREDVVTLNNLGRLYYGRGDNFQARAYYVKALSNLPSSDYRDVTVIVLNNIGDSYLAEAEYDEARR